MIVVWWEQGSIHLLDDLTTVYLLGPGLTDGDDCLRRCGGLPAARVLTPTVLTYANGAGGQVTSEELGAPMRKG